MLERKKCRYKVSSSIPPISTKVLVEVFHIYNKNIGEVEQYKCLEQGLMWVIQGAVGGNLFRHLFTKLNYITYIFLLNIVVVFTY